MAFYAHAKINLGLHILGKRDDNYHEIETVYSRILLADKIELTRSERGVTMTCDRPKLPTDDRNLCVKAAKLFFEMHRIDGGVHIDLKKIIPLGSGLGGGSSNAAVTLMQLHHLYGIPIDAELLQSAALKIGMDVPYFLTSQTAYATGRGEILTPSDQVLPYWVLIVIPYHEISTVWAYSKVTSYRGGEPGALAEAIRSFPADPSVWRETVFNDLEPIVFRRYPHVEVVKRKMYELKAKFALMSGSGATVFGLFDDMDDLVEAYKFFDEEERAFFMYPYWGWSQGLTVPEPFTDPETGKLIVP